MKATRSFPVLVLVAAAALGVSGCKGKVKVLTETKIVGDHAEVSINVDPPSVGSARFTGQKAFEQVGVVPVVLGTTATVSVPLGAMPIGKYPIAVTFEGTGRGLAKTVSGTSTFTFDRKALAPSLKLVPIAKPGASLITCKGDLCDTGTRLPMTADAKLSVDLTSCAGCTVEVSGQKIVVRGDHTPALLDMSEAVAATPAGDIDGIRTMKVPFKITGADGGTSEVPLEMLGGVLSAAVLRKVASGPLKLAGEAAAGPPHAAVIVRRELDYGVVRAVGNAQRVRDFDLVGVATSTETSLGTCGVYRKEDTKTKVVVDHKGATFDVTMYDRRTGKSVGRRSFGPVNKGCFDTLAGDTRVIVSLPADDAIDAWAKSFLK